MTNSPAHSASERDSPQRRSTFLGGYSDFELAALAPLLEAYERLVPLPRYDDLDATARVDAYVRGLRSLRRRMLVAWGTAGNLQARGALAEILERQATPKVIAFVDLLTPRAELRTFYAGWDGQVLEQASRSGRHQFTLVTHAVATQSVRGALDPRGFAQTSGPELCLRGETSDEWRQVDEAIAEARSVSRMTVVDTVAGEPRARYLSVVGGPNGTWVIAGIAGADGRLVAARRASPELLLELGTRLLSG